jgi:beta-xylosidase
LTRIDEVSTLDGSGNLVIDRDQLRTAVRTTANFPAVTGPVTLDGLGNRVDFFTQEVWDDNFSGAPLDGRWSWLDEDPTHWSLTGNPGFMQITTQSPGMNRLVQMTPPFNFVIRTRLLFTPVENFQIAGLTVFNDIDNRLVFGRAYCDIGPPDCVGNGIYFDHVENGSFIGGNYATSIPATGEAYLRLEREGSNYTGYVSENGTEWTEIGTHTIDFTPTYIGFYVDGQSSTTATPADFDFFLLEHDKYHQQFLPIAQKPNAP